MRVIAVENVSVRIYDRNKWGTVIHKKGTVFFIPDSSLEDYKGKVEELRDSNVVKDGQDRGV